MDIFTVQILLIQEHVVSYHFLIYISIYFFKHFKTLWWKASTYLFKAAPMYFIMLWLLGRGLFTWFLLCHSTCDLDTGGLLTFLINHVFKRFTVFINCKNSMVEFLASLMYRHHLCICIWKYKYNNFFLFFYSLDILQIFIGLAITSSMYYIE